MFLSKISVKKIVEHFCSYSHSRWDPSPSGTPPWSTPPQAVAHCSWRGSCSVTTLCYGYQTASENWPACVLDTISCPKFEFHSVIMLCKKVKWTLFILNLLPDRIQFDSLSLHNRKWWLDSTAFTNSEYSQIPS